jgi:uroporphyrinogen-III decarboxylase
MTDQQWQTLKRVVQGEQINPLPVGFIIDCPWLPNWYGAQILDYFTNQQLWLESNLKAINDFPDVMFLPGFWSEFGMCTEPSAFGARCNFPTNEFPHAHKVIKSADDIEELEVPNPETDGLLPFMLNRLKMAQPQIEAAGHKIRFAVARGPLNIASYLMGSTELLTTMMMMPEKIHSLMEKITEFLQNWFKLQMDTFPSIDGIFMLDDIIGFMGETEFREFGLPYFKALYDTDVSIKFLHNDAPCRVCAPILPEMGVNLFNMGFDVTLSELQELTGHQVTLMGNLPPRDVLAAGSPEEVAQKTAALLDSLEDTKRIVMSCGGGMPPGVTTENINAFVQTVQNYRK